MNNSLLDQIKPTNQKVNKPLGAIVPKVEQIFEKVDLPEIAEIAEFKNIPIIQLENSSIKAIQKLTIFEMINYCNIYYNSINQLNSPFKILDDDHLFLYDVFKYKYYKFKEYASKKYSIYKFEVTIPVSNEIHTANNILEDELYVDTTNVYIISEMQFIISDLMKTLGLNLNIKLVDENFTDLPKPYFKKNKFQLTSINPNACPKCFFKFRCSSYIT